MTQEKTAILRKAVAEDKEKVLALYRTVQAGEYCTWNEYYPSETEFDADIASDSLYTVWEGERLVAAASVVGERELDGLTCWKVKDNVCEIARIAVSPEKQGQGIARRLLDSLENEMKKQGVKAVHLLVAQKNIPAFALYQKAGYIVVEKTEMYGDSYFACEKILSDSFDRPRL